MKLYTKGGDSGSTSLVGGERARKDDLRVEAYGSLDELTAFIGLLTDKIMQEIGCEQSNITLYREYCSDLERINSMLMSIEAHLASGEQVSFKLPELQAEWIDWLESRIDTLQEPLPKITKFTIPGGDTRVSLCHVCRTVARRCERRIITASEHYDFDNVILSYMNRLSDYLYVLGRSITFHSNVEEREWHP
ncbi:MAG: cob(I)yrinic acid a,c-diamide adenosyltransferase [Rikenellaceae bacterium]